MAVRRANRTIAITDTGIGHALLPGAQRRDRAARSTPRLAARMARSETATGTEGRAGLQAMAPCPSEARLLPLTTRHERGGREMGRRKPNARIEFVLFNVIYEDGTVTSNRKVPSSMLGGLDG